MSLDERIQAIDEGERQGILLALALCELQRPGWHYFLGKIAHKLGGVAMYEAFKKYNGPPELDIVWKCHACGEDRPDALIQVYTYDLTPPGLPDGSLKLNLRYCADRPACLEGAQLQARQWSRRFSKADSDTE